jgi:hypothetical protein
MSSPESDPWPTPAVVGIGIAAHVDLFGEQHAALVVVWLEQGVVSPALLGLDGESHVHWVRVVGADDLVVVAGCCTAGSPAVHHGDFDIGA